jgi:hypothetical protein
MILILAIQWFNWDRYRGDVASWIGSVMNRTVTIDAAIDFKLFPSPRVYLSGVSIGNAEGNFTGQFLYVESAHAKFSLLPLFIGNLVLEELHLDRPRLRLEIDSAGHSNWRFNDDALSRLRSKTPTVMLRQLWVTRARLEFVNIPSGQNEGVDIQEFLFEASGDYTTFYVDTFADFHGVPIRVRGTLGDMGHWSEGHLSPISLQYAAGDIEGELSGEVTNILDRRVIDLHYIAEGDHLYTIVKILDLGFDFDLGVTPFSFEAEVEGNWQAMSLTNLVGDIAGSGFQIDMVGEAGDLFRRNDLDIDIRGSSDSLNDLMTVLGQRPLVDGTAHMTAHLLGGLHRDLELRDMEIELQTSVGLANAKGVVRVLDATAPFEDFGAEMRLSFDILTDDLKKSLAVFGQEIPIDGIGSAEGLLIRAGGHYRIEDLSLAASAPEFSLRATGEVDALDDERLLKIQFEARTEHLRELLSAFGQEIPIDGIGSAEGLLIRAGGHYRIEDLSLAASAPEFSLRATGEVEKLGHRPKLTLQFEGQSPDLGRLSKGWIWPLSAGIELVAVGSLRAVAGTVVTSGLTLTSMGQKIEGHFFGRLPSMGHSGRPDWLLQLNFGDLGDLMSGLGGHWIYRESGQFTLQVRPLGIRKNRFHVQAGLSTTELDVKANGELTGFDAQAGFELAYSILSPGIKELDESIGFALSKVGGFQAEGSLMRTTGNQQPVSGSIYLVSDRLGSIAAEGVFRSPQQRDSEFRVEMQSDSISEVAALVSFPLADVGPFRGEAIMRLRPEQISLDEFHLYAGDNDLHGSIAYRPSSSHDGRTEIYGQLQSSYLNVNALLPPPERIYLFSAEPLPVRWASTHDVEVDFKIARFLRRNYDLRSLTGKVVSVNGEVEGQSNSSAFGGDLELHLILDTRSSPYHAKYEYDWSGLNLALLPAARKVDREISGRVKLKGEITGSGNSLHQIMARGNGYLFVDLDSARFLRGGMELLTTSPINIAEQILREVSPWAERKKFFEIECGVIGMRIENGIGRSLAPPDHTIAIKAKEFRLAGFGDLQLMDESLSLSVRSKARRLGLSAATLIEQSGLSTIYSPFYRIVGTLLRPKVEADPEGRNLLETGVKLGAAWATGGTSVVLLSLIDRLAIEPVGCEGARDRARRLAPGLFP